jgi:hypothetical protein
MRTIRNIVLLLMAALLLSLPLSAQTVEGIAQRLDQLERQNANLLEQISLLRRELDELKRPGSAGAIDSGAPVETRIEALEEKVETQAGLVTEQSQVKVEGSQRFPIRLTGMVLFNAFRNTAHSMRLQGPQQYPRYAEIARGPSIAGASVRQTVIGMEFQSPYAVFGGSFQGKILFDLNPGGDTIQNITVAQGRLRLAYIEGRWKTRGILVGHDKPIFNPREPNSLAQVSLSPLAAAGNPYQWMPQASFVQRLKLGAGQEFSAQIGVGQVTEDTFRVPAQFVSSVEVKRPGLEGHFQLSHRIDEQRRVEIATGFHTSTSHVLGASVPSRIQTLDWFWNPLRRIEFAGALFTGKNLASFGGVAFRQSFTFLTPRPGQVLVIPVRTRGGWAQLTFLATSRLSFNLQSGLDDPNNRDLPSSGISRNRAYVANMFYRLAPNVVTGAEVAQMRTRYIAGQHPMNNHYDLYLAYMF